jgi:hypothetical protein
LANVDNTSDADKPVSTATQTALDAKVPNSRTVSAIAPLTGGGDLSANRTLTCDVASGSQPGCLSSADWTAFNNKVATSRTISTTAPLSGGGDLSANRTLTIPAATTSVDGYLSSADWNTFNAKQAGDADLTTIAALACADGLIIKRASGAWGCGTDSTGSAVAFREFVLCSGACVTFTNLGAGPTEMGSQASRNRIELANFTNARVITNWSVAAVSGDFKVQCSDDTSFGSPTDMLQWDNPAANTLIAGTFAAIPAGCKTAGGVYVRVVGINGNGTEDPAARFIKIQVE